jgi:cell division protein FtsZ
VDPAAQTFVQLVVLVLVGLLLARIATSIPGWLRRDRRPEARSILVVGVGGGGGNAVDRMVDVGLPAVGFVAVNTDAQALRESRAELRVRIGDRVTRGLGSGGDPEIGRRAAEEDAERIGAAVAGADLVFVTAGLGGGTGSGAAPTVAAKAREGGALTIAVVTKPFDFEGTPRRDVADDAAEALLAEVDAMITVPNDQVGQVIDPDASALEAFRVVDEVLLKAVEGIVELLTAPGLINLDFADIRSVVQGAGPALIGLGEGRGEDRAIVAARQAASSPLLEASIEGARGVLLQISGPADLSLREVRQAADVVRAVADPRANVIFGASIGGVPDGEVHVTLIATGLDGHRRPDILPRPTPLVRTAQAPVAGAAQAVSPATSKPAAEPVANTAPTQLQLDPEDALELPTFLRNPRPTSGTGRRRDTRKTPTPTGSRPG